MGEQQTVTAARMKEIERAANDAGLSYRQMMENAGYQRLLRSRGAVRIPKPQPCLPARATTAGTASWSRGCWPRPGAQVRVVLVEGLPVTEDAAFEFMCMEGIERWPIDELGAKQEDELVAADVVVDAVYGTGFTARCGRTAWRAADMMNRASGLVCALDLPSGVNADTGEAAAGAVRAGLTVTFHARKQGQDTPAAAALCGEIVVADIGITAALASRA